MFDQGPPDATPQRTGAPTFFNRWEPGQGGGLTEPGVHAYSHKEVAFPG